MTNKTWGGRFKKPLHPLAVAFNVSLAFDHMLYLYDIMGSKTYAIMLATQGLISNDEALAMENGCSLADLAGMFWC